ncbi:DASH complex subunit dad2 [Aspergillus fumigatus]
MAYSSSRPTSAVLASTSTSSSIRQQSNLNAISHQQSLALSSRIVSKKAELENLMRLRDLSGAMAMQMQVLETKISTLRDGTEAMACVLANWDNVLRAISMASTKAAVSISKKDQSSSVESGQNLIVEQRLPVTLVRIPAEEQERPHD